MLDCLEHVIPHEILTVLRNQSKYKMCVITGYTRRTHPVMCCYFSLISCTIYGDSLCELIHTTAVVNVTCVISSVYIKGVVVPIESNLIVIN